MGVGGRPEEGSLATQTSSSNTRLVAVGGVVLLVGVILVLLILRGTVSGDDPVAPEEVTTSSESDNEQTQQAPDRDEQLVAEGEATTARIDLPLEVEDGHEAVAVQAGYERGVAAVPSSGDRVVLYALAAPDEDDDSPSPTDDAERLLADVEVLGVVGPRPAANEGTLTFVLSVAEDDVAELLPAARDRELWLTLLPGGEVEADEDDEE